MKKILTPCKPFLFFTLLVFLCVFVSPLHAEENEILDINKSLEKTNSQINNINTKELQTILEKDPLTILIDVRTIREANLTGGTIDARHNHIIPRGWLEFRVKEIAPESDTPIVVYCGRNLRSPLAAETLTKMGYSNVKNYADGLVAWKKEKLPINSADEAPNSMLYRKPEKVVDGVWSAIGETAPGTYENSGHNNNLSFVITEDGVLVVNAGDNYLLAKALHEEIKALTDQPVKYVVLENGQGHAMLGSNYWQEQGAEIIAHKDTAHEIEENAFEVFDRMKARNREKAMFTKVVMPDKTFDEKILLEMGSEKIEILNLGPAHSPGDIVVWLPQKSLVISGDVAFHVRLLPVFEHTDTDAWIETWDKFAALNAKYVIPGHGGPTNMEEVTKYTKDYLAHMRKVIGEIIEDGGDLQAAYKVDQSAFSHLDTFDILDRQNAGRIFREMEFE